MPLVELKKHNRYDYSPLPERPDFSWPGGKRLAFCINNNIEVFSFLSGLGSDSATGDGAADHPQLCVARLRQPGRPVALSRPARRVRRCPARTMSTRCCIDECPRYRRAHQRSAATSIIGHGRTNAERQDVLWEEDEARLIDEATRRDRAHRPASRTAGSGRTWRKRAVTLDLLKEAGYKYVMDWPADDQPFWMRTRSGPLLSVPYSLEINDLPALVFRQHCGRASSRR